MDETLLALRRAAVPAGVVTEAGAGGAASEAVDGQVTASAGAAVADRGPTIVQAARDHDVSWPVVAAAFTGHACDASGEIGALQHLRTRVLQPPLELQPEQWGPNYLVKTVAGLLRHDGYWQRSIELHERAVDAAQGLGNRLAEANARNELGLLTRLAGRLDQATEHLQQALALYRLAEDS